MNYWAAPSFFTQEVPREEKQKALILKVCNLIMLLMKIY